jgi:hypothetical protein
MCKGAGDFMSTRIEADFPRWERLYRRVWGKVRQDAEAANKRRARSAPLLQDEPELRLQMAVSSSLALAPSTPGSKFFTSHHRLWRALVSLFMTVLEHVRLPFEIGDRICEVLCDWVVLFVGPEYYFLPGRVAALGGVGGEVEDAIRAMEGWNGDLTWFVFMRHRVGVGAGKCGDVKGEEFRLAEVVF